MGILYEVITGGLNGEFEWGFYMVKIVFGEF